MRVCVHMCTDVWPFCVWFVCVCVCVWWFVWLASSKKHHHLPLRKALKETLEKLEKKDRNKFFTEPVSKEEVTKTTTKLPLLA